MPYQRIGVDDTDGVFGVFLAERFRLASASDLNNSPMLESVDFP
jgi:hypothetical protein